MKRRPTIHPHHAATPPTPAAPALGSVQYDRDDFLADREVLQHERGRIREPDSLEYLLAQEEARYLRPDEEND